MHPTLRDFLSTLEAAGELRRIAQPVSPVLQIAHAADGESKRPAPNLPSQGTRRTDPQQHHLGGQALLFENVQGSDWPVLINAWGSYRRLELAFGNRGLDELAGTIAQLVKPEPPSSFSDIIAKARQFLPLLKIPPKRRRGSGLCQEVVIPQERVDLTRLPIIKCWPLDGDFGAMGYPPNVNDGIDGFGTGDEWNARFRGRYITLAGIHTIHADDRDHPKPPSHNIGMYRVQLLGKQRMAMHWHVHHDGARHWRSWKHRGEAMPVAVVLGGESVLPYAATAPLPPGISELLLAGFLNGRGIPMVRAKSVPLWVPANAEIVIEGYVSHQAGGLGWDPRDPSHGPLGPGAAFEGPFGDHTGFYSLPDRYPILNVTCITHRRDPIYPTTVVGLPPQEDYFLGKATERLFLPLLKTIVHDIDDYDLPMFGAFHNCACVRIKKAYPLQGRRVMHSVWGAGQMAWTKNVFVVDKDVDVHDVNAVLTAAATHCDPGQDIETVLGPVDILDHAAPRLGAGMKVGFDCTRKIVGEDLAGKPPRMNGIELKIDPRLRSQLCDKLLSIPRVLSLTFAPTDSCAWLLLRVNKAAAGDGARVIADAFSILSDFPNPAIGTFLIALPSEAREDSLDDQLFHWLAHSDASRDAHRWHSADNAIHRIAFDSTRKLPGDERLNQPVRDWPPLLSGAEPKAR